MINYSTITEQPSDMASKEQLDRLCHRYRFALQFCEGKDVLEVACGAGIGLGYLARKARRVVGGDIDKDNLKIAREHYRDRRNIEIEILDAHKLPFKDKSFDVVVLYEAIYYLLQPDEFIGEAHRVLRNGGRLIVCTVNKDWSDFNPSPFSSRYFSIPELHSLLNNHFSKIEIFGSFNTAKKTFKDMLISLIKRSAVFLHLVPRTTKGKEIFKRIFFGKLSPIPLEIGKEAEIAGYSAPDLLSVYSVNRGYKILYAVGYMK